MNLNNISRVGLGLATVGVVILAFRESLLAAGLTAIAVQVASTLLMLWARLSFGRRSFHAIAGTTEGELMMKGPYKYLRHPIYAAALYFLGAGVLSHPDIINGLAGALVIAGLAVRIMAEEHLLAERYTEYAEYSTHTKRIIPFIL